MCVFLINSLSYTFYLVFFLWVFYWCVEAYPDVCTFVETQIRENIILSFDFQKEAEIINLHNSSINLILNL